MVTTKLKGNEVNLSGAEVNGETIYVLDKFPQEDNNDRSFEKPEVETGTAM
jgi:hypothetical protein